MRLAVAACALFFALSVALGSPIDKCPPLPPHTPTSVRDLHPNDIKVVMAMGDSMTAGFGIYGRAGGLYEYRGESAAIGGDAGQITAANFFRHYTPDVVGASTGYHLPELPYTPFYSNDNLNAAQSNAGVDNLLFQLDHLVAQLKENPNVSMANDWKFLNLIIGANDACPLCWDPFRPSVRQAADSYEKYLRALVEQLHEKIPRVFFNILPMFNVSQVYNLSLGTDYCDDVHIVLPVECTCAFDSDEQNRVYLDSVLQAYNQRIYKIAAEWNAKNLSDFVIVTQPFSAGLKIPDLSYLSDLDCFHPSLLAHQKLAIATWNSLLTPVADKKRSFDPDAPLICPDADTLLCTS